MIFGTSGVRGYVDKNVTPSLIYKLTLAYIKYTDYKRVIVGQDDRPQSKLLKGAVIDALLSQGVEVFDAGLAPTPALARFIKEYKAEGAISITGSHTPPYIAGVLYFLHDTGELGVIDSQRVESIYYKISDKPKNWRKLGKYELIDEAIEDYVKSIKRDVGKPKSYRFLFDAANGAMGRYAKAVFEDLGLNFKIINYTPLGDFPVRLPSPIPQHLRKTALFMKENAFDVGIATDSDGDRAIFMSADGRPILGDIVGAYFASLELNGSGDKVVTPINSSDSIIEVARRFKAKIVWTKVGPPAIVDAVRKHANAVFAFEESGKYIWPKVLLYGDAVFSALKALSLDNFLENLTRIPRFYVIKREVRCADEIKYKVIEELNGIINVRKTVKDGIKAFYSKHDWLLIRASGTEPLIRVFGHSKALKKALQLAKEGVALVKGVKSKLEKTTS